MREAKRRTEIDNTITRPELWRHQRLLKGGSCPGRLTLNLATLNVVAHVLRTPSIDLTSDAEGSSQNLLDRPLELLCHRLEPHRPRDRDDLIERDGFGVLDVLLLLPVSGRFFEGFDDEG